MKIPGMKPAAKERPSKDSGEWRFGGGDLDVWEAAAGLVTEDAEEAGREVDVGEAEGVVASLEHMPLLHV